MNQRHGCRTGKFWTALAPASHKMVLLRLQYLAARKVLHDSGADPEFGKVSQPRLRLQVKDTGSSGSAYTVSMSMVTRENIYNDECTHACRDAKMKIRKNQFQQMNELMGYIMQQ